MYEQFKNDFMMELVEKMSLSVEQINEIMKHLDVAANDYEILRKEKSLVVYNQEIPHLVKMFLVSKKIEGYSKGTLYNYATFLKLFFYSVQKAPEQIEANDIRVFLYKYQEERQISNQSLEKIRNYFACFFKWMTEEGYIEKNPMASIKQIKHEKKRRQAISQIELEYLRRACETPKQRAALEVLYSTGCRIGELVILKKSDIDWNEKTVHLFGKGKKHRTSFLNAKAEVALKIYLDSREDESDYLFVSDRKPHNPMKVCGMQKIIRELSKRANTNLTNNVTAHVIRHTTATRMYENNVDVGTIQAILGHSSVNTTMIYVHNSLEKIKSEHKKSVV